MLIAYCPKFKEGSHEQGKNNQSNFGETCRNWWVKTKVWAKYGKLWAVVK